MIPRLQLLHINKCIVRPCKYCFCKITIGVSDQSFGCEPTYQKGNWINIPEPEHRCT